MKNLNLRNGVLGVLAVVGVASLLPSCSGSSSDLEFAKSSFQALCRGDKSAADAIDFEMFSSSGVNVGQMYLLLPESERKGFRDSFVAQFAASFQSVGGSSDQLTNWRVESEDSARTVVACDAPSGKEFAITVSKRDGHQKISSLTVR